MTTPPTIQGLPESRSDWQAGPAYAVFVSVLLITMIIATAVTFILPESYASTARVRVEVAATNAGPYFIQTVIQTEAEVIRSQVVLSNVIKNLNLNVEWGKKYFNGEILKTSESMDILKGRLSVAPVRNTEILAITIYSDDRREAATLANAVAGAYQDFCLERLKAETSKSIDPRVIADSPVVIIDAAVPASRPCKPNKPLNLALGAAVGLFLGAAVAWLVGVLNRRT